MPTACEYPNYAIEHRAPRAPRRGSVSEKRFQSGIYDPGEDDRLQVSANFERLVLGCIEAVFCSYQKILFLQGCFESYKLLQFCIAPNSKVLQTGCQIVWQFFCPLNTCNFCFIYLTKSVVLCADFDEFLLESHNILKKLKKHVEFLRNNSGQTKKILEFLWK